MFAISCSKMIEEWKKRTVSIQGSCEVDVWPEFQKLTADVISRAAFGSDYEHGKKIFELQKELIMLVLEAMQTLYIPGFRYSSSCTNKTKLSHHLNKCRTKLALGLTNFLVQVPANEKESEEKKVGQRDHINAQKCNPK